MKLATALAAAALTLAGASPAAGEQVCDGDPANPLCPVMSYPDAAHVYLSFMCPANKAASAVGRAVRKYDKRDDYGDRPHAKTRKAARRAAREFAELSDQFAGGYTWAGFWPADVTDTMEAIAQESFTLAGVYADIAAKGSRWTESNTDLSITLSLYDDARYRLGLGPRGTGC